MKLKGLNSYGNDKSYGRTMGIRKESKMYIPEFIAGVLTCIGIELIVLLVWAWVLYKKNKGE